MEWAYNGGVEREKMEGCFFYADCDAIAQKLTILKYLKVHEVWYVQSVAFLRGEKKNDQVILYKKKGHGQLKREKV